MIDLLEVGEGTLADLGHLDLQECLIGTPDSYFCEFTVYKGRKSSSWQMWKYAKNFCLSPYTYEVEHHLLPSFTMEEIP